MISNWSRFCAWPAREMRHTQDKLLAEFLREDVAAFHPYYRSVFEANRVNLNGFEGVRHLADLPFTTKADIIAAVDQDPLAFLLKPTPEAIKAHWPLGRVLPLAMRKILKGEDDVRRVLEKEYLPIFMTATTGRASRPVPFLYTKADIRRLGVAGRRLASVLGVNSSDKLLNLFPYAPHLAFWQVAFAGFEAGIFALSTGGGKTIGTAGNIRAIERIKPSVILGVPSYVYHLLRIAEAEKVSLANLKLVVMGAEKTTDSLRVKVVELAKSAGAKDPVVLGTYGFTEAKMAWSECPGATGYHLFPDLGVFEIIDPATGEVKGEGESGEIVYTSIGGRGTVVVRYRTGDYSEGGITWEPCPYCAKTVPRLSSRITRLSNQTDIQLTKVKGALIDLNHIAAVLSETREIEEWQVELSKKNDDPDDVDFMTVYIAPAKGAAIDCATLSRRIFDATEVAPNAVVLQTLDEMITRTGLETEMKEKRILDKRPK